MGVKGLSDQKGAQSGVQIRTLLKQKKHQRFQDLAKLLTLLDREGGASLNHSDLLTSPTTALRIGITGPPGAGKSTLVARLAKDISDKGYKVAVLAVDPTSPFTNGAILGDRIRFADLENGKVFIRSIGSRGYSGGLTASAYLFLRAFDLWGFDFVLLETVGVGQTELEVMTASDHVCVVLVPESGDMVQAMKAGLTEIADTFVVNKSDRPGADGFAKELKETVNLESEKEEIEVIKTEATTGKGLDQLSKKMLNLYKTDFWKKNRNTPKRLKSEAKALLYIEELKKLNKRIENLKSAKDLAKLFGSKSKSKSNHKK